MRLYTFINFYLSQIQQGIQSAHIVHELFNKYPTDDYLIEEPGAMLKDWSKNHKTIYVCNAGADPQIQELIDTFIKYEGIFPWVDFVEDEGLCNARTGCGIVLPEWIYNAQKKFEEAGDDGRFKTPFYWWGKEHDDGSFEEKSFRPGDEYFDLIDLVKSKRLA